MQRGSLLSVSVFLINEEGKEGGEDGQMDAELSPRTQTANEER